MFIYSIENTVNNKKYIGLTGRELEKRFCDHKTKLNANCHANKFLQNDWNLFGERSFSFKFIYSCNSINEMLEKEKFYIDKHQTLFNQSGYNIHTGGKYHKTPEYIKCHLSKVNSKKIAQYSLKGNFIKIFDSIEKASNKLNLSSTNIITALKGVTKTAGGYQWRYYNSSFVYTIDSVKSTNYRRGSGWRKEINKLTKDNKLIKTYNSIKEAAESIGLTPQSIQQCLYGKSNTSGGFKWEYRLN